MALRKGQVGVCKLMGTSCTFVKSHLIPRALTPPRAGGVAFPQFGGRQRPSRRFDSWYDMHLVGHEGEKVLECLDTFAIEELRRLKLVWQSFGPMLYLSTSDHNGIAKTPYGIRRVVFGDAHRMRLFFLSLLWRAAATDRPEFAEVSLAATDLIQLGDYVRNSVSDMPWTYFPVTLTQIATLGPPHNHAPIARTKKSITVGDYTTGAIPIFRFFLDGLIAHVHCSVDNELLDCLWPMLVGPTEGTAISTVTWNESWQLQNLAEVILDAEHEFPGGIGRADGLHRRR